MHLYIFAGIENLVISLSYLVVLSMVVLVILSRSYKLDRKSWISLIMGLAFCNVAIFVASSLLLAGDFWAGLLGLVAFGFPGVIILFFARKMVMNCAAK